MQALFDNRLLLRVELRRVVVNQLLHYKDEQFFQRSKSLADIARLQLLTQVARERNLLEI